MISKLKRTEVESADEERELICRIFCFFIACKNFDESGMFQSEASEFSRGPNGLGIMKSGKGQKAKSKDEQHFEANHLTASVASEKRFQI